MANKEKDASQMHLGQTPDLILKDGEVAAGGIDVIPVTKPMNSDYLDELKFMEEPVTVMIYEGADQNDELRVPVGNNGNFLWLDRGKMHTIKRKFLDSLIVRKTNISTPEYIDGSGARAFRIVQRSALKYPFTVTNDTPKGVEWLQRRLAEII